MNEDDELMAEIARHADRAAENASREMDLRALAISLGPRFHHRTVEEIQEQLITVWRARRLVWRV
ncbi:hypothetical protein LJR098_002087 [Rhizobium sp. LjRoot98]|uniref:hypothetical protein n=1 Tax=Rhizobium sp. LjRoot98 TaxID=3342345 RepID=UPI003ECCC696